VSSGRALVTGVAGFIGSHVAEVLLSAGTAVTGVDNFSDYYSPAIKRRNLEWARAEPHFEVVVGSLNELDLGELLDGVEVVYHLAGQPGVGFGWGEEFDGCVQDNTLATQRLLEAVRGRALRRLVFASSSSVYGQAERLPTSEACSPRPLSPYGVTKLAAEGLCGAYWSAFRVPAVVLRYFTVYGPRQRPDMAFSRFIDSALDGVPLTIHGDGGLTRDFTYVGDAARAAVAAASHGTPGGVYNVAGGSRISILDSIAVLEELVGAPIALEHVDARRGEPRSTGADTTAARRDLRWAPRTPFRDGLAAQLAAQRAARAAAPVEIGLQP
jgi:nucleoside-diphosphate-sugar epimerase